MTDDLVRRRRRWPTVIAAALTAGALCVAPFVVHVHAARPAAADGGASATDLPASVVAAPTATPSLTSSAPTPSEPTPSAAAGGVVPWADLPVDPLSEPTPLPSPSHDASLPTCLIDQLSAAVDPVDLEKGFREQDITVTRTSGSPCVVKDTVATVTAVTPDNQRETMPLAAGSGQCCELSAAASLDSPDSAAHVRLYYVSQCANADPRPPLHDLQLTIAGGGVLQVGGQKVSLGCLGQSISVTRLGATPYEPEYSPVGLTVTIKAPAEVHVGETMSYVVTLTNTTASEIPLSPCLNYRQAFKVSPWHPEERALNCAAARPIPVGGSESFAMQLEVPDAVGSTPFIWVVHTGPLENVSAAAMLHIAKA